MRNSFVLVERMRCNDASPPPVPSDTGQRCPVDNEMLSEEQLFPDNFAKREILSLTVRCPNAGCKDKMELRHLEVEAYRR